MALDVIERPCKLNEQLLPASQEIPDDQRSIVSFGAAISAISEWTMALQLLEDGLGWWSSSKLLYKARAVKEEWYCPDVNVR